MKRSHTTPYLIVDDQSDRQATRLEPVDLREGKDDGLQYNEAWLQNLLLNNSSLLPIEEIEPIFAPAVSICRELPTSVGPIDLLLSSPNGLLTIVETKLWKNPEARREVVGQLLDYAKELRSWSYENLDAAVRQATKRDGGGASLFAKMNSSGAELDETEFVDAVASNLDRGRFLLIIAGDGIREEVERLTEYLQRDASVSFTLALVELALYKLPREDEASQYVVAPRVLARTVEIERAIVRIEGSRVWVEAPTAKDGIVKKAKRSTLTCDEIYEQLAKVDPDLPERLVEFFGECEERGLIVSEPGKSLIIHWPNDDIGNVNFGTFFPDGRLHTNYIAERAEKVGDLSIAEYYLTNLAKLIQGAEMEKKGTTWNWRVAVDGKLPRIADALKHKDAWLHIIEETIERFRKQLDKVSADRV